MKIFNSLKSKLKGIALLSMLFVSSFTMAQTINPADGAVLYSNEVVSFDWYFDTGVADLTHTLYVINPDKTETSLGAGFANGQNHAVGKVFEVGEYQWYQKAWNGTLYKSEYRSFTVVEGNVPVFAPEDGGEFHPNQILSFDWFVPVTATANKLVVYASDGSVYFESVNVAGGQQHIEGGKFVNDTYTWKGIYTDGGVEAETAEYTFSTVGDANTTVIEQYGITWYIKGTPEYGKYANGEYWVVGPIELVKITPQSIQYEMTTLPNGDPLPAGVQPYNVNRIINGSMINPETVSDAAGNVNWSHGFDDELAIWKPVSNSYPERVAAYAQYKSWYKEELNIARVDVGGVYEPISEAHSRSVAVNSSIVSSISCDVPDRPVLEVTAILTVVAEADKPVAGDFRPPYSGYDKKSKYNVSDLDYSALKTLEPTPNMIDLETAEALFERNWIDILSDWQNEFLHAKQNMQASYGANVASAISHGAVALNTEYGNGTADKEILLKRMTQLGLDLYGVVTTAGGWRTFQNNGGLLPGRKLPIMIAGKVLNDTHMLNIKTEHPEIHFHEEDQTFYVTQADIDMSNSTSWNPDSRDAINMPYEASDINLPEWGIRHATNPEIENKYWDCVYRRCCNESGLQGSVLAAHAMGLVEDWGHDAYFDYMDRYLSVEKQLWFIEGEDVKFDVTENKSGLYGRGVTNSFVEMYGMNEMWVKHRATFGPEWKRTDETDIYSNGSREGSGLGILENEELKLSIIPNPVVDGSFAVDAVKGNYTMEIFDLNGRIVYYSNKLNGESNISTENLKSGVYFVKVLTENNKNYRAKLIIKQ
ncbi:MAG: T9SS type A sorting domain-containing protein [Bacteroidota bacterium]